MESTIMEEIEGMLRKQLRNLVKSDGAETDILLIIKNINSNLDIADRLLPNTTKRIQISVSS
jgi:hypothetical protein